MPTTAEMLNRWKTMAGDSSPKPWDEDSTYAFFQIFRPHGEGVQAAFEDVVGGDEILRRLLDVYRATASTPGDWYFVVRDPPPITRSRVLELLGLHLAKFAQMAAAIGDDDAARLLKTPFRLEAVEGQTPWPPTTDDPEACVYDMRCDFMQSLEPQESHALLMEEAFYSIACDYYLSAHLLWPLYRHSTDIEEPFLPHFELWRHGVGYRFVGKDVVRAYVPPGKLK